MNANKNRKPKDGDNINPLHDIMKPVRKIPASPDIKKLIAVEMPELRMTVYFKPGDIPAKIERFKKAICR